MSVGAASSDASGKVKGLVHAPALSLPKGGGAVRGICEKFAANPVTGTGLMTIPIATSPGRSGFGPELSLSYDSGAGNGSFGLGWNLSLPAIVRKTDKGLPRYLDGEESDVFILSGAEDLVPEIKKDANGAWIHEDGKPVVHGENRSLDDYLTKGLRLTMEEATPFPGQKGGVLSFKPGLKLPFLGKGDTIGEAFDMQYDPGAKQFRYRLLCEVKFPPFWIR